MSFNRPRTVADSNLPRINHAIRIPEVRLITDTGDLGVVPIDQARSLAVTAGMDLVEVVPTAKPPVVRICDAAKWIYDQKKREKDAKKKQQASRIDTKEMTFRPSIGDHDLDVKIAQMRRFIADGDRVKVQIQFRGREITHSQLGYQLIERVIAQLDTARLDGNVSMSGNHITVILVPK